MKNYCPECNAPPSAPCASWCASRPRRRYEVQGWRYEAFARWFAPSIEALEARKIARLADGDAL